MKEPLISIVIPTYNEAETIGSTIEHLRPWSDMIEIIVVDGGSSDGTAGLIPEGIKLIQSPRGRAVQMNAGARQATGKALLFLHSDTRLPHGFLRQIELALANHSVAGGAFKVKFDHPGLFFHIAALGSNLRAGLARIYFGDQAIFARRETFNKLGGFPAVELMEDWEFSRRLGRAGKTMLLPGPVTTSARRWLLYGKWRTAWLMHKLKLLYLLGVSPAALKRMYTDRR
ncbi:TIGR04283 family arsenosugar biosynthesis glycosyltransferase [Pelotomaculum terephthalicicum JT]|uniref:TIGR04283 family arsenosugar biosynthesis glycosyltransferase n=1 Tax=Pelotomaculum terephthalicicum TaxID=206393 RepID=UPI001F045D97|nr:TIGR04283 family arsenosugar biosynthesis glycosyltransferase [Pelotomaculum terephthalicicum]MCG9966777.1 TIGR04283 family arsenosugar biosynthesis glycosyltransferase [Pelotomaculum terephthalicicum JT]